MDLINLIKDKENDSINEDIFNENIRVYKEGHQVNQAIIDSANEITNYQFFYLNNGITFLCEEEDYVPHTKSPTVNLKDIQIINGGQTSHSLFHVFKVNVEVFLESECSNEGEVSEDDAVDDRVLVSN